MQSAVRFVPIVPLEIRLSPTAKPEIFLNLTNSGDGDESLSFATEWRLAPSVWITLKVTDDRCGRVEDGRGSLGPMANAPFPIPAHQTGRADFRHPAFRLASPRRIRRDCSGQALEAQNAVFSMNYIECESAIAAPLHLVPSREEPAHTFKDVLVDATVCLAPRAVAKVIGPASQ